MMELAMKYAALKGAAVIGHKGNGKEITFVLSTGPKLTMTESQLKLAISNMETPQAGTVADVAPEASAPSDPAPKARKPKKES